MEESKVGGEDVRTEVDQQLEPITIAKVSDVTGAAPPGESDPRDNVVWGND